MTEGHPIGDSLKGISLPPVLFGQLEKQIIKVVPPPPRQLRVLAVVAIVPHSGHRASCQLHIRKGDSGAGPGQCPGKQLVPFTASLFLHLQPTSTFLVLSWWTWSLAPWTVFAQGLSDTSSDRTTSSSVQSSPSSSSPCPDSVTHLPKSIATSVLKKWRRELELELEVGNAAFPSCLATG